MSDAQSILEERAKKAILWNAFMRLESAITLGATIAVPAILTAMDVQLFSMPNWGWLVAGLTAYGGLVWSSFSDDEANHKVVEEMLAQQYNPKKLKSKRLQAKINEALDYRGRITAQINKRSEQSALKVQLLSMADQFDDWLRELYDLTQRLDAYELEKPRLKASYESAHQQITKLTKRLNRTRDQQVKDEINANIISLSRQIDAIESLHNTMSRAELRVDNTVAAMGTIYPQTLLLGAKDIDSSRYKRLQQEIQEEVSGLGDVLYAMDEVYNESSI